MAWDTYLRTVLALVFVLALISGVAWLLRRFGGGRLALRAERTRRLGVVEVLPLDGRRKLVLARRDNVLHLLLIGGGHDLIVERGIADPPADGPRQGDSSS